MIQRRLAALGNVRQRFRIFRLHHALTDLQRRPVRQVDRRNILVLQHLACAVGNAFVQIWRRSIAARGVLDRGLHDVGEAHGAEPLQRLAPGLERARHRHRFRPGQVFIADRIEHVMRRARFGFVGIGPDRQRHRALAVDEAMAAISQPDVGHAAADDADHHRLDHRQREQRRDRGIDGVAAGGEHFGACTRRQRMIADHHAAAAGCRLFLTLKAGGCAIPPMTRHASFLLLVIVLIGAIVPLGSICPDDHNSIIGHHCN